MAKVIYRPADSPDDLIYNGRFMISSHDWSQTHKVDQFVLHHN